MYTRHCDKTTLVRNTLVPVIKKKEYFWGCAVCVIIINQCFEIIINGVVTKN